MFIRLLNPINVHDGESTKKLHPNNIQYYYNVMYFPEIKHPQKSPISTSCS